MGHEIAGEIVEVGEGVTGWAPGDRVQVIAAIPCGECDFCTGGLETICPNQVSMGYDFDGGFAPFMIVPPAVLKVDGLNRIPDGVSFAEASVAEPFACAINAQELIDVHDGDTVVVVGSGPIGCLHVRLARARGAETVYLVELSRERLDLAAEVVKPDAAICAGEVDPVAAVLELTGGKGVSVVITAAASGAAQEQALQMLAPRGRFSLFGGLPKDKPTITLDSNVVHYKELMLMGANGSSPDAQPPGARHDRRRSRPGLRPHHPPAAARPGRRGHRHRPWGHGHQGHDRTLTIATVPSDQRRSRAE